MFRIIILLLVFSVWCNQTKGQEQKTDFERIMNQSLIPSDSAYQIMLKAYAEIQQKNNAELQYDLSKRLAILTVRKGSLAETATWYQRVDSLENLIPKQPYDKEYEFSKTTYFQGRKMTDSLEAVLERMKPLAMSSKDTFWILNYYVKMAWYNIGRGDKANAYKYIFRTDSLNQIYKSEIFNGSLYGLKASISWKENKMDEAIEYFKKAVDIYEKSDKSYQAIPNYRNMISLALAQGRKRDALAWDQRLKQLQKKHTTSIGFYDEEINRIFFYITMEEYAKALQHADSTIALGKKAGRNFTHALYLKGIAYRGLDQYDKAAPLIEEAFNRSKANGHADKCKFYAEALYQTYYWKQNYEPALQWYITFANYRDTLYNENKLIEMSVYQSKLETLEEQRKVEELQAKAVIQKQKNGILWLLFGLLSFIGFSFLYTRNLRTKQELLAKQIELTENRLARENLELQLEFKEREITTQILSMADKNTVLQDIRHDLVSMKDQKNQAILERIIRIIDRSRDNDSGWERFLDSFKSLHNSFLHALSTLSTELTSGEIRLASLLKMNLSSKEISSILNITEEGVKKARYRLRKKLNLDGDINIQDFLVNLG